MSYYEQVALEWRLCTSAVSVYWFYYSLSLEHWPPTEHQCKDVFHLFVQILPSFYRPVSFLDALASLDLKLSVSQWVSESVSQWVSNWYFFTASATTGLSDLFLSCWWWNRVNQLLVKYIEIYWNIFVHNGRSKWPVFLAPSLKSKFKTTLSSKKNDFDKPLPSVLTPQE